MYDFAPDPFLIYEEKFIIFFISVYCIKVREAENQGCKSCGMPHNIQQT
jgi:hypothetical protein